MIEMENLTRGPQVTMHLELTIIGWILSNAPSRKVRWAQHQDDIRQEHYT